MAQPVAATAASTASLLLEIGVEELPSSFVDGALAALPDLVVKALADVRLPHGAIRVFGTPRRLAVHVREVARRQADVDEESVGPPEGAAYRDGQPTKAAEAFAAKLGIDVGALRIAEFTAEDVAKAKAEGRSLKVGRFAVGRKREAGKDATALLGAALGSVLRGIPFRKSMRWGAGQETFGRPVRWLVALFGTDVVPFSFGDVASGRVTFGHRFLAPGAIELSDADGYEGRLEAGHVIADREKRASRMMTLVTAAAERLGGTYDRNEDLVSENASLVEEPFVVVGSFDSAFLSLPAAVIRSVARGHQKYFCVEKSDEELLPHYLAIANTAERADLIAQGNDRVMRARLSDARFFFDEDRKLPLSARVPKLAGIVFHQKLGSMEQKIGRMGSLCAELADHLAWDGEDRRHLAEAVLLCKADLVSLMVGEFPELQGHMGRAYALGEGLPVAVADAIRDHYRPLGAEGDVPTARVAALVALADRMDTLAGCFAIGLSPTSTTDPYGLRRSCIAVLRLLMESPSATGFHRLDLGMLMRTAYETYKGCPFQLTEDQLVDKLSEFSAERLRGLLAGKTSNAVADAVLAAPNAAMHPHQAAVRARALHELVARKEPWLEKARIVAKRMAGISREAEPLAAEHASLRGAIPSKASADQTIVELVRRIDAATGTLTDEARVRSALEGMVDVAVRLDAIFSEILVNDPADSDTPTRLRVLSHGARCMLRLADFSRLA